MHPVTSVGCIAVRHVSVGGAPPAPEVLMVQRRHSLNYMEAVLGKYDVDDTGYVGLILANCTHRERAIIANGDFSAAWRDAWQTDVVTGKVVDEYERAREKYHSILPRIPELLTRNPSPYREPEWGFPKGRRKLMESMVDCGVREFLEETGIRTPVHVVPGEPFVEDFVASNGIAYRHIYYIVHVDGARRLPHDMRLDARNHMQVREVRRVRWMSLPEAFANIRPRNWQRVEMLRRVASHLNPGPV
jgi:8-oxo-dGTP pyrophosphatase MutT (NUDIX family)